MVLRRGVQKTIVFLLENLKVRSKILRRSTQSEQIRNKIQEFIQTSVKLQFFWALCPKNKKNHKQI